jgi:hypothetical protein
MRSFKTLAAGLFAFLGAASLDAQTADEIISKHTDAIGGKDKLSQIKSVYIETSTETMGDESPSKTYIINGKNYRNESEIGGQTMVGVVNDKSGWAIMPFGGSPEPKVITDEQFKASADYVYAPDPLTNYSANGAKVELLGQEKVNNIDAFKIVYTNKFGSETTYYIDPSTYYIVQSVKQGGTRAQAATTTTYSNYKKIDFGIFMPYTVNVDMGQFALEIDTKKIELNKEIDPKTFELPKK